MQKFIEDAYTTEKFSKPEAKELLAKQQEAYQVKWKQMKTNITAATTELNDDDDEVARMYFPRFYAYE